MQNKSKRNYRRCRIKIINKGNLTINIIVKDKEEFQAIADVIGIETYEDKEYYEPVTDSAKIGFNTKKEVEQ